MSLRNYRSEKHAHLGGVCSGIALAHGYSVSLVRIAALLIFSVGGIGLILYLLLWALLPKASTLGITESEILPDDPLKRSRSERMLGGVCGGIGEVLGKDPNLIRVLYIFLVLFAGLGIVPYVYAWIVLPQS